MDIEPTSNVRILIRDASKRIDGCAAFGAIGAFFVIGLSKALLNLASDDMSFQAWKIVLASALMVPLMPVLYFNLAFFNKKGSQSGRLFNAVCLVTIPIYLFVKLY